ncbi:hypothetical protein P3W85_30710 [Cupriavidus basilensis]|uniref:DUF2917 domain-containing protein n=1 Tax=Cupriavidus basilensis TaxID=68895 RepID=A0ABT6AXE1_9BURK|nr:hypothetical protein [Cupriavidus basilensis]MDF3837290.1 hypothetical protein [Cupriavidus basilensis]
MQSYRSDPVIPAVQPNQPARGAQGGSGPEGQKLDLESSRVLRFHARAGTTLYVLEGEVELSEAPRWLAGTMWRQPQRLPAGSVVALPAGWVEVLARRAATLRLQASVPRPWWRRWLAPARR